MESFQQISHLNYHRTGFVNSGHYLKKEKKKIVSVDQDVEKL